MGESTSPTRKKQEVKVEKINFYDAIKAVVSGKKVTKSDWGTDEYHAHLKDGLLMLHKPDGIDYTWIVSEGDIIGEDFLIIN